MSMIDASRYLLYIFPPFSISNSTELWEYLLVSEGVNPDQST